LRTYDAVPEAVEMTARWKALQSSHKPWKSRVRSHISTARRLLHSLSNQLRKEALLNYQPYLFSRLILQLEKTAAGKRAYEAGTVA
jgi:hypothetical protein